MYGLFECMLGGCVEQKRQRGKNILFSDKGVG